MKPRLSWSVLIPIVSLTFGCSGGGRTSEERNSVFSVWDSAGIAISMSTDSVWKRGEEWLVEPEASVTIGTRGGGFPETAFGQVTAVDVLSDGRIAVADAMAKEIRVFDQSGNFLNSLGHEGAGPAEFRGLGRIGVLAGDSIVGRDYMQAKSIIFASDGSGSRTVIGPSRNWNGLSTVVVAGWMPNATSIATHNVQRSEYPPGTGLVRTEWHFFDPDGSYLASVGPLPYVRTNNQGEGASALVFSSRAGIYPDSTGFWYGFPEEYELVHYTSTGIDRIVRIGRERERVTEELRESYRNWYEERSRIQAAGLPPEFRYIVEARVEDLSFSEALPAYRRFLVSEDGHFWLANYQSVHEMMDRSWSWDEPAEETEWTVVSHEGEWLGTVRTPPGVSVRVITGNRIVGITKDEMDVQYVVVHELQRSG